MFQFMEKIDSSHTQCPSYRCTYQTSYAQKHLFFCEQIATAIRKCN
jgi:hypothetical protein